jgi:hypothetical protein
MLPTLISEFRLSGGTIVITDYKRHSDLGRSDTLCKPPQSPIEGSSDGLRLTVVFTKVDETLSALRKAADLASQLGARIQILAPFVVPYPLPIDHPSAEPKFRLRHFHTRCEEESIPTQIEIRLCRNFCECIMQELAPHSLVVVGGRRNWWPFSQRNRLVSSLTRAGHQVVSVKT